MPAGSTYTPIATTTLGSDVSSYTFSSISGSYTDLVLVSGNLTTSVNNTMYVQLNGDTATNYSGTVLYGNGTSAGSGRSSNLYGAYIGALISISSSEPSTMITHFQNYSNTTTNKTVLSRYNFAGQSVEATVALWRSTSAINSIKIYVGQGNSPTPSGNLKTGSTFTLYGIASA